MASMENSKKRAIEISENEARDAKKIKSTKVETSEDGVQVLNKSKSEEIKNSKNEVTEDIISGTGRTEWEIMPLSTLAKKTVNPIRIIIDQLKIPKNTPKPMIPLSIGDPTVFGNLDAPRSAYEAIAKNLKTKKFNGYAPSFGIPAAREAIARKHSTPQSPLTPNDIIIASGCSGALTLAIQAIANEGDNILLPKPGFCLYATICGHSDIKYRYYNLLPDNGWEIDIKQMESIIDERTKAILLNNPANPTGSNYSKEHLLKILEVAEKHKIPIISDEIYAHMVFPGEKFHSLTTLTKTVPLLVCGGLAKQYLVPGWRVGWVMIHDRNNAFKLVRKGLVALSSLILGACVLVQSAVADCLLKTSPTFYPQLMNKLKRHADIIIREISKINGLKVIIPQGAMYVMVEIEIKKFRDITSDMVFSQKLMDEEYVFVLPGECFGATNFFRIVFCAPDHMLKEACKRIEIFCQNHYA